VQCSTQQYHQPGKGRLPPTMGTKVCIHVNNASDKHNELEVHSSLTYAVYPIQGWFLLTVM